MFKEDRGSQLRLLAVALKKAFLRNAIIAWRNYTGTAITGHLFNSGQLKLTHTVPIKGLKYKEKQNNRNPSFPSSESPCSTLPLKQAHINVWEASNIITQVPQELSLAHKNSKCYKNERQHKHN